MALGAVEFPLLLLCIAAVFVIIVILTRCYIRCEVAARTRLLAQSEANLRRILENMPVMLDAFDTNWVPLMWNKECERVTSYSAAEIIGHPDVMSLFTPNPEERARQMAELARLGNYYRNWEGNLTCKDGSVRRIAWTNISRDFPVPGWPVWGVGMDVTELRQAEAALRESETRYRTLFEKSHDAIYLMRNGVFEMVNQRFTELTGYTQEEIASGLVRTLDVVAPRSRDLVLERDAVRARGQTPPSHFEFTAVRRDGTEFEAEVSVTYLPHPTDKVGIGIARDVTERKRREADQLELALQRERVETLKTFISDVSHDLMTPITIVNSALYLLRKSTTPEKTAERLKQIETQVARLEKMIGDMLTMARLDRSRRAEFTFEEADLNALVGHVVQEFQPNAAARHQTLDFTADSSLPPLPFDSDKLHRALANLIDNALRYTPEEGHVRLSTGIKGSHAFIEVKDSGIGIAPRDQSRIFERFFRGSAHRPSGSMGLGLPIARTIVQAHGGEIEVHSVPGQGSAFRMLLPLTPEPAQP